MFTRLRHPLWSVLFCQAATAWLMMVVCHASPRSGHDSLNRITKVTYQDGSDRRVRVVEKESGTVTSDKRYVYHDLELLEERASDNSTVLRRFYENGHVDVADSGKRYAYTTDHLGSIREVMLLGGTSGNPTTATLAARYDYDLWGKRTVLDGGSAAETLVMQGYTGHVYHKWSGLWLAPYRAYSSGMGRWLSRDPIAEDGGINLYAYVGNAAVVSIDSLGLHSDAFYDPKDKDKRGGSTTARGMRSAAFWNSWGNQHPATSLEDIVYDLERRGGLTDGVSIFDHGAPGVQQIGEKRYSPEAIAEDVAKFIKPGGFLDFHGCNLAGNNDTQDGDGLNDAMAKRLQDIADKHQITVRAQVGFTHYPGGNGWPAWHDDEQTFTPKKSGKGECYK